MANARTPGGARSSRSSKVLVDDNGDPIPMFPFVPNCQKDEIIVSGTAGKPNKVYKVVEQLIPDELREPLASDFSDYERHEIFHRIDIHAAECDHEKPKALWIFGPPAVGKTTIANEKACDLFGRHHNAVVVDGSEFRVVHKGFQMVAQHGLRNNLLHADAWATLKGTGCMDRLKEEVVELAIERRQHLKIPETANSIGRVNKMLEQLVEADYELHAMCLWAPKSETEARGRARGVVEGKAFSVKAHDKATASTLVFGEAWLEKIAANDPHYKSVMFYDNTVFPSRPVHFSEFKHLTNKSDEQADRHAKACKESRNAAIESEIAYSKAWTQGHGRISAVKAGLDGWMAGISSAISEERPSASLGLHSWVEDLASCERQRGRIQGLVAGICVSIVAVALVKLHQARH